ncbi:MAG: hypothetical protein L3J53_05490 [Proteobacteria bacterium]|nr:hypothetical protein [Pseudomonadota bacterium]
MKTQQISQTIYYVILILSGAFYYYSFYPGYMSFDSATQYAQVRSGEWSTISPVIMVALWTFTDKIISGPGGLFLFFIIIFLLGILLFTKYLRVNYWVKIIITLSIVFWPFNLMILPHLWKDVGLIAFLCLSIGLIQTYLTTNKILTLYLALFLLLISSLFRFEAILYLNVLIFYVNILILRHFQQNNLQLKSSILTLIICVTIFFINNTLVNLSNSKKITLWPTIAIWDLASISIKVDKVLLPEFTKGVDMTVEDLSNAVYPWSNIPLMTKTKAGINVGVITPFTDIQYQELFKFWLGTIFNHPKEYLQHRLEVLHALLNLHASKNKPIDLYFSRKMHNYAQEFHLNDSLSNQKISQFIQANINFYIFQGWVYFIIGLLFIIFILISKKIKQHEFAFVLACSGCMSVAILFFISPSAEQRYLIWLVNSVLFVLALFFQKKERQ